MDDDLILNIAVEPEQAARKGGSANKGGRWTDRYALFCLHAEADVDDGQS